MPLWLCGETRVIAMDEHVKKIRAAQVVAACILLLLSACRDRHEPSKPTVALQGPSANSAMT